MIRNVIKQGNYLKENFIKFKFFQEENQYLSVFEKNRVLNSLSSSPFTLRLIITILPTLNSKNQNFTRFEIYQNFTYLQYFNELKRIQENFAEILDEYWGLDVNENDIYDYENLKKVLFPDLNNFNIKLCWHLLSKNKIVISVQDVYTYF